MHKFFHKIGYTDFRIQFIVLTVDEETSVKRQLARGRDIEDQNKEESVLESDLSPAKARDRYKGLSANVQKITQRLKHIFKYDVFEIDASGKLPDVKKHLKNRIATIQECKKIGLFDTSVTFTDEDRLEMFLEDTCMDKDRTNKPLFPKVQDSCLNCLRPPYQRDAKKRDKENSKMPLPLPGTLHKSDLNDL
eukprot:UN31131